MFSIANETKAIRIAVIILLAAMLFGCIFASFYYNDKLLLGSFETFSDDDVKYLRSAETFIKTGQFTYRYPDKPTVFIMPGLTILLAPFVAVFGLEGAVMPVRMFFALLQTFSLYMVFLITRKIFNSKVALIAMVLSLLYLPNIYVSTVVLTEPPAYAAFLVVVYLILYGTEKGQKRYFIAGGIMWGISVMFRPTIGALPLVSLIYWIFKKVKFKDIVKYAVCAAIPLIIFLTPWTIRNYVVFDRFIPLTQSSGNPKLQGTIIDYSLEERERMFEIVDAYNVDYGDTEISVDEAETEIANRIFNYNIKNNTAEYVRWYTIGKTIKNFNLPYMWYPIYLKTYLPITHYHKTILWVFAFGILFLAVRKKLTPEMGMLLIMIMLFNCMHLAYYCFSRYMYMIMCFIIMIVAYVLYELYGICKGCIRKRRRS